MSERIGDASEQPAMLLAHRSDFRRAERHGAGDD